MKLHVNDNKRDLILITRVEKSGAYQLEHSSETPQNVNPPIHSSVKLHSQSALSLPRGASSLVRAGRLQPPADVLLRAELNRLELGAK